MQHEQNGMNDYTRLLVKKILYCVSMMCLAAFPPPDLSHSDVAQLCNEPLCCFGGVKFLPGPPYVPEDLFLGGQVLVKSVAGLV